MSVTEAFGFTEGQPSASGDLYLPAGSPLGPLTYGQRVTVTHGDFTGAFRVTGISYGMNGPETYQLEPAGVIDARETAEREARNAALPAIGEDPRDYIARILPGTLT